MTYAFNEKCGTVSSCIYDLKARLL